MNDPSPRSISSEWPVAESSVSEIPDISTASKLHRIVVVGGGAGGLELVTRLGDTLGRRGRADVALVERSRTHLWKPLLHEVAAGSMDVSRHELDYLAQAYWHGFNYRFGEMIGPRPRASPRASCREYR